MVITPIRIRFTVDTTSPLLEGVPTLDEELEVAKKEDYDEKEKAYAFHFEIQTYDRGDEAEGRNRGFYQIAFRIDDPSPYNRDEIELHLDESVFEDRLHRVDNDLYYNSQRDLWYQKSRYEYDERKGRYRVIEDDPNVPVVDSVTASGVFRVVAKKKDGQIAKAPGNPSPWIYILPGAISITEYKRMLSELISLHEQLIINHRSSVGVGSEDVDYSEIKEIVPCIHRIIRSPSEQLEKKYIKTNATKIKHFDQRVMLDYVRTGGTGKITSIGYSENHDSYENRIIKLLIRRMVERYPESESKKERTIDIISEVRNEMQSMGIRYIDENIRSEESVNALGQTCSVALYDSGCRPLNNQRKRKIVVKDFGQYCEITTNESSSSHNFMRVRNKGDDFYNLQIRTRNFREALFFLHKLCEFFDSVIHEGVNEAEFHLVCGGLNTKYLFPYKSENCDVYIYEISDIREINNQDISTSAACTTLKSYFSEIERLCRRYDFIQFQDRRYDALLVKESLIAKKKIENKSELEKDEMLDSVDALRSLLNHQWFCSVSAERRFLKSIRKTPKFILDKNYAKVYRILSGILKKHPLLSAEFNISAFGVKKTEQVYEYWVFYKLLQHLINLGFRITDGYDNALNHFRLFVQSGCLQQREHANYTISLVRDLSDGTHLPLEFGFDCEFGRQGFRPKTPDFYFMIPDEKGRHWFFMDAKYKPFTYENRRGFNLYREIYQISIVKYIKGIYDLLPGENNKINGSYIIAANISETDEALERNNRLFGAKTSIAECGIRMPTNENIAINGQHRWIRNIDNANGYPGQRYGAIQLLPGKEEELKTLLLLIFEYLLTDGIDNHRYLANCWNCDSTDVQIITSMTRGGFPKYYSKCQNPDCRFFRVQNHCKSPSCNKAIIKHAYSNFHAQIGIENENAYRNQWMFICPACGNTPALDNNEIRYDEQLPLIDEEFYDRVPPEEVPWD